MNKCSLPLLFITLLFSSTASAAYITGKCLLKDCESALDIYNKNSGYIQTEDNFTQGIRIGMCKGFIASVKEIYFSNFKHDNTIIEITAIVKYIKDHPAQQNMPASTLVVNAFKYYFAC